MDCTAAPTRWSLPILDHPPPPSTRSRRQVGPALVLSPLPLALAPCPLGSDRPPASPSLPSSDALSPRFLRVSRPVAVTAASVSSASPLPFRLSPPSSHLSPSLPPASRPWISRLSPSQCRPRMGIASSPRPSSRPALSPALRDVRRSAVLDVVQHSAAPLPMLGLPCRRVALRVFTAIGAALLGFTARRRAHTPYPICVSVRGIARHRCAAQGVQDG